MKSSINGRANKVPGVFDLCRSGCLYPEQHVNVPVYPRNFPPTGLLTKSRSSLKVGYPFKSSDFSL